MFIIELWVFSVGLSIILLPWIDVGSLVDIADVYSEGEGKFIDIL
jgi:hypothetical protein